MSEYSKLTFTDGTLITAELMNQLSNNIEYALETPPSGLNVNGKTPDGTKTITLTAADTGLTVNGKTPDETGAITLTATDVEARANDWMPTAEDVGALSGTDATLTQTGKAADAKKVGTEFGQLKTDIGDISNMISDAWSADKTYAVGDYCIYNNKLYKAIEQTSTEPGNNSYWNLCNITDEKVAYSDVLTLEEIQASSDLTNKIANAEAVKSIKYNIGTIRTGSFYSEKNKGNTMPADYGGFIRLNGNSWPGSFSGDTYYIGVASNSTAYLGIQINKATQITWVKI